MNQRTMLLDLRAGRPRPMRLNPPVRSSASRSWDDILVEEFEPAESASPNVALMENVIFMPIREGLDLEWSSRGQRVSKRVLPGQVSILPADHPYSVRVRAAGGSVVVSISHRLLACSAAEQGTFDGVEPVWMHGVDDSLLCELVSTLRDEMWSEDSNNASYARSIASAMAAHIVRGYSTTGRQLPERKTHQSQYR